jgi:hypothetical protein
MARTLIALESMMGRGLLVAPARAGGRASRRLGMHVLTSGYAWFARRGTSF